MIDTLEERPLRPTIENITGEIVSLGAESIEITAIGGRWDGERHEVVLRKGYVLGRKEFAELVAAGLEPGGIVEIEKARPEPDGTLSALRVEILKPRPGDVHPVVLTGVLASILPREGASGAFDLLVVSRDQAVPAETLPSAFDAALRLLAEPPLPGTPGVLIRAVDPDLGVCAVACLPEKVPDRRVAAAALVDFAAQAELPLAAVAALLARSERPGSLAYGEVVPLTTLPVAADRASRFAAQVASHRFVDDDGQPRFTEATVTLAPDKRGHWQAVHMLPGQLEPTLSGVDYEEYHP